MSDKTVEATAYIVVEGRRSRYYSTPDPITGLKPVESAAIVALRQSYPSKATTDQVIVKVRIALPAHIFDPLVPTAVVNVPEDLVRRGAILVEAVEQEHDDDEG
jgi:hypothetical protein